MQNFPIHNVSTKLAKALTLFLVCFSSHAKQDLHTIIAEQAQAYVEANISYQTDADITIETNTIDSRIKVPACRYPFNFQASPESLKQSNVSVKVSCPSNEWYLFTNVKVSHTKPIVVASDILGPGTLITKENAHLVDTDISRLRTSSFSFIEDLEGARLKRRLRPGQVITRNMLCFVCKGDKITIAAQTAGLNLRTSGIAQQDGNLGDTIRVRNIGSNKQVSAIVASTQEVHVAF